MTCKFIAFGIAKDLINEKEITVKSNVIKTVGDAKDYLVSQYPAFKELLSFSLAVGDEYRNDDYVLQDNDEIMIIPPVSGG